MVKPRLTLEPVLATVFLVELVLASFFLLPKTLDADFKHSFNLGFFP